MSVLLVDKNPASKELVERELGVVVDYAPSSEEAMSMILSKDTEYGAIIVSHSLPKMSGTEMVRNLRKMGYEGKIICASSRINEDHRDCGADACVEKTMDVRDFGNKLRAALSGITFHSVARRTGITSILRSIEDRLDTIGELQSIW